MELLEERNLLSLSIPILNSYPQAKVNLFLDFDGNYQESWGHSFGSPGIPLLFPGSSPAFSLDDNPEFNQQEIDAITEIWTRVSEDFSPFNINVTTNEPQNFNDRENLRVTVGGDGISWIGYKTGGVAFTTSFYNPRFENEVFVFPENLQNNSKFIASAISHEAAHAFGVSHQSSYLPNGTKLEEYNTGTPAKAPIMGNSYNSERETWWAGPNTYGINSYQEDQFNIASKITNGFGYKPDDYPNSLDNAVPLAKNGIISTTNSILEKEDIDAFYLYSSNTGILTINVNTIKIGANLDVKTQIYDENKVLIYTDDNPLSLNSYININVSPNKKYYLTISSHGDYGDTGQYSIEPLIKNTNTVLIQNNEIAVYDSGILRRLFYPYPNYKGPISIARSDIDNDGTLDVIVGSGQNVSPHVKVFSGQSGTEILNFIPFDIHYLGGINVASQGNNIIVGANTIPHVKMFNLNKEILSFYAFNYNGGVNVVALNNTIITAPNIGSHIRTFNYSGQEIDNFLAFDVHYEGEIKISTTNNNELIVVANNNHTKVFKNDNEIFSEIIDDNVLNNSCGILITQNGFLTIINNKIYGWAFNFGETIFS